MEYISTTELRTKTPKLKESLEKGDSVYLVHRSSVIGVISPYREDEKVATLEGLKKIHNKFSTGKTYSKEEIKDAYHKHLKKKYG